MDVETKNNLELRRKIHELGIEIMSDIEHGECFYEWDMLQDFRSNLDKLKNVAKEYYISNKEEI